MTGALNQTPQESDSYKALDSLLRKYIEDTGSVLTASKRVNKFNVGMTVFLGLVALPSIYGLMTWTFAVSETGWQWVAWPVTVIVGLSLLLLIVAGMSTIYDPPKSGTSSKRS